MESGMKKNILITGLPGVGKTTLVRKIAEGLDGAAGFYTEEIREGGERKGFRLVTFDGYEQVLAHVGIRGPHRVSKYGVDVEGFEKFLAEKFDVSSARFVVIDEIGKMECFSPAFREKARGILDSPTPAIFTIARKGGGFIEEVKARADVEMFEVTRSNRGEMADIILRTLKTVI
jgi:nucleoside-triphosphatase